MELGVKTNVRLGRLSADSVCLKLCHAIVYGKRVPPTGRFALIFYSRVEP